ncbi:MAG TPA: hypothetical protein VG347_04855 [Verrucomicrobiae bacterium]|nr:hypothetical protein [Verrucomicrobiae bacterium]
MNEHEKYIKREMDQDAHISAVRADRSSQFDAARQFLKGLSPAVSGSGGDKHTYMAALTVVNKYELTGEEAMFVLGQWNRRCVPPWPESELRHKVACALEWTRSNKMREGWIEEFKLQARPEIRWQQKPVYHPTVLKRIAAKTRYIRNISSFVNDQSPVPVNGLDSADLLRRLYPYGSGEKVIVFSKIKSQGQFVWIADHGGLFLNNQLPTGPDGVWFLPQPVTGEYHPNPRQGGKKSRRSQESVTSWRYVVLESDEADPEDWLRCLIQLPLKIATICESGGRSIHALVRLDAQTKTDWDLKVGLSKPTLVTLGADPRALTAIRLTRLPQAWRGARQQRLLYFNPNPDGRPILGSIGSIGGLV